MADEKLTALTELMVVDPTDLLYVVDDVGGTPTSKKIQLTTMLGGSEQIGGNLVRNSPGQIVTDGAEPQWWDDIADAVITDEDAAGEACEDKTERVFKVVTAADDVYGLQTLTFADEDLLDAGETVVSFGCWVWCASASKASIGIYGTNLTLQESGQHTGGSGWEWLTVENQTLDGADADIEIRLIVDTGTAFFTMPMLCVGPVARSWVGREEIYVPLPFTEQLNLVGTDVAYSDTDMTANTDVLATGASICLYCNEPDGTINSHADVAHYTDLVGTDVLAVRNTIIVVGKALFQNALIRCSDGQVIRYEIAEVDNDSDLTTIIYLTGYWRWA